MTRQRGFSLGGLLLLLVFLTYCSYTAFRVLPAYLDYWLVQKTFDAIANDPGNKNLSDGELKVRIAKELNINYVSVIHPADVEIERIPEGIRLSADYSSKVHYLGAVSLAMDFKAVGETH